MRQILLPSSLGKLHVPQFDFAPHLKEVEQAFLKLLRGDYRKLLVSIPIRHGKSMYTNLFIAWLLISKPTLRILRVMASSDTAIMEAREVRKIIAKWGEELTGVKLDKEKAAIAHFAMQEGGELRSVGMSGDVESWTFDWIFIDDAITDPYEIRNPNRRDLLYRDICTKFFSRVNPMGNTKFVFIGSRRHPTDPQGRLLEASINEPNPKEKWHYHCRPALFDENTENERALWPTSKEFDLAGLRRLRAEKQANGVEWEWFCNFQNDPVGSPDQVAFDAKWFRRDEMFYNCSVEAFGPPKYKIISVDPSHGKGNELNDYFSVVYLYITWDGVIYIDDSWIQVCKPDAAIMATTALLERHQDHDFCVFEANAAQIYCSECIKRECDAKGIRFNPLYKTWGPKDDKIERIVLNLWEVLSKKMVKLRDTPWNQTIYRQLANFPTEKLDGPDSLATAIITLKEMLRK